MAQVQIGGAQRVAEIISALYAFDPRKTTNYAEQFIDALLADTTEIIEETTEEPTGEEAVEGEETIAEASYQIYMSDAHEIVKRIKPFLHLFGLNFVTGLNNYFDANINSETDFTVDIPSNTTVFPKFDTQFQVFVETLTDISKKDDATKRLKVRHIPNHGVVSAVTYLNKDGSTNVFTAGGPDLTTSLSSLIFVLTEEIR